MNLFRPYIRAFYCKNCTVIAKGSEDRVVISVPIGVVELEVPLLGLHPADAFQSCVEIRKGEEVLTFVDLGYGLEDAEITIAEPARAFVYRVVKAVNKGAANTESADFCILQAAENPAGYCIPLHRIELLKKLHELYQKLSLRELNTRSEKSEVKTDMNKNSSN